MLHPIAHLAWPASGAPPDGPPHVAHLSPPRAAESFKDAQGGRRLGLADRGSLTPGSPLLAHRGGPVPMPGPDRHAPGTPGHTGSRDPGSCPGKLRGEAAAGGAPPFRSPDRRKVPVASLLRRAPFPQTPGRSTAYSKRPCSLHFLSGAGAPRPDLRTPPARAAGQSTQRPAAHSPPGGGRGEAPRGGVGTRNPNSHTAPLCSPPGRP